MSYTPQVGDVVTLTTASDMIRVLAVDGSAFWGSFSDGRGGTIHTTFGMDDAWVKVTPRPDLPELPERWAVIHVRPKPYPSLPYYDSPQHARRTQDDIRSDVPSHPPDLAYVRYVPDPESVVWADEVQS